MGAGEQFILTFCFRASLKDRGFCARIVDGIEEGHDIMDKLDASAGAGGDQLARLKCDQILKF